MSINIEQLDNEEKSKIKALVRERNDKDRNKGVDYIFRQHEDKEQYLLGKKLDLNQMVKDDKALMGESEAEFNERMEHRKMLEKMREDPISIIHFNEAQAHKIAMEKKRVHDRLNDKNKLRNRRMSSSTDSDSDDILEKLLAIVADDDHNPLKEYLDSNIGSEHKSNNTKSSKYDDSRKISRSRSRNKGKYNDSTRDEKCKKRSNQKNCIDRHGPRENVKTSNEIYKRRSSRSPIRKNRRSISRDYQNSSRSRHTRKRSRSFKSSVVDKNVNNNNGKTNYSKQTSRMKLSDDEKQRRLKEMEQNAHDHQLRCHLLDKKYHRDNEKEAADMEKQMTNHDMIMLNNTIKMSQNYSLEHSLAEKRKQSMVKHVFKR